MPGSIRLFVTVPLAAGAQIVATAAQAYHLGVVMRRAVGDPVVLFNGSDGEWAARIVALRRGAASFVADEMLRPQAPEPDLWLVFALLKRDATDLVVQKATESASPHSTRSSPRAPTPNGSTWRDFTQSPPKRPSRANA